ncbi:MAG: RecQ family ATP-dependent DNA helicase [Planctomycetota bacterium]
MPRPDPPTPTLDDARSVLRDVFGHNDFRGQQTEAIERTLAGSHTLVLMPTGGGKSVCYQVPALLLDGLTVVLSPLVALMKDQVDALVAKGVDAAYINATLTRRERDERYTNLREGKYKLLYVTPERFRKDEFRAALATRTISLLAIDEAHCVSGWGHDFRPDYTKLAELRQVMGNPTTIALTATATPRVQSDIVKQLGLDSEMETLSEGIDRPNLSLEVDEVWGDDEKLDAIVKTANTLQNEGEAGLRPVTGRNACPPTSGAGIVYFALIRTLETISEQLRQRGVPHLCYHGKLERQQRKRVQDDFLSSDPDKPAGHRLVLATNAFGMGIDKPDIRFVMHAEVPGSVEGYYQEIGRAGRDGKPARCTLLYDERDLETQMMFIRWSNPGAEYLQRVVHHLEHDAEQVHAFGIDWLREKLHHKQRGDFRLETALNLLYRHGVIDTPTPKLDTARPPAIEDAMQSGQLDVVADLPDALLDKDRLADKLRGDQQRLYGMVEYVRCDDDRRAFLNTYFGVATGSEADHDGASL